MINSELKNSLRMRSGSNAMMKGEFSQFDENSVLLAHDQIKVEKPIKGEVRVKYFDSIITGELSQT